MGGKIRIAIVDESAAFRVAAAGYIARLPGCLLAGTAEHASQAPALVRRCAPDLLLVDLGPAPARGLDALGALKGAAGAPAVVAMTLFASPEMSAAARQAGAAGLVGKDGFVSGLMQILAALQPAKAA